MTLFVPKGGTIRTNACNFPYQSVKLLVPRHGTAPAKARNSPLPEASRYIVLRLYLIGISENLFGIAELHHLTHIKESRTIAYASSLLHIMGNDYNGVLLLQLVDKFLYLSRGNGVEGRRRLIHQQDGRRYRHGTGYAKALLLSAGKGVGRYLELVFHLIP